MSESYNVSGKVVKVGDVQQITETFSKRELWVETESDSKYPQTHGIEFKQDKASLLDGMSIGDMVSVECNLEGWIWNDKVFNSLAGWKINVKGAAPAANTPPASAAPDEDIPF